MEGHVGIEITVLTLEAQTKKKLIEIRNKYIANGEMNFTLCDVVTKAVNALSTIEEMQEKANERRIDDARRGSEGTGQK